MATQFYYPNTPAEQAINSLLLQQMGFGAPVSISPVGVRPPDQSKIDPRLATLTAYGRQLMGTAGGGVDPAYMRGNVDISPKSVSHPIRPAGRDANGNLTYNGPVSYDRRIGQYTPGVMYDSRTSEPTVLHVTRTNFEQDDPLVAAAFNAMVSRVPKLEPTKARPRRLRGGLGGPARQPAAKQPAAQPAGQPAAQPAGQPAAEVQIPNSLEADGFAFGGSLANAAKVRPQIAGPLGDLPQIATGGATTLPDKMPQPPQKNTPPEAGYLGDLYQIATGGVTPLPDNMPQPPTPGFPAPNSALAGGTQQPPVDTGPNWAEQYDEMQRRAIGDPRPLNGSLYNGPTLNSRLTDAVNSALGGTPRERFDPYDPGIQPITVPGRTSLDQVNEARVAIGLPPLPPPTPAAPAPAPVQPAPYPYAQGNPQPTQSAEQMQQRLQAQEQLNQAYQSSIESTLDAVVQTAATEGFSLSAGAFDWLRNAFPSGPGRLDISPQGMLSYLQSAMLSAPLEVQFEVGPVISDLLKQVAQ